MHVAQAGSQAYHRQQVRGQASQMGCQMGQGWAGSQLQTVLGRMLWGLPLVEHQGNCIAVLCRVYAGR